MLSAITHELGNSVSTMAALVSALRRGLIEEQALPSTLASLDEDMEHLSWLVEDLRELSHSSPEKRIEALPIDAESLVLSALHSSKSFAEKHGQTLSARIEGQGSVHGQRHRLAQIFKNLLLNAVLHNSPQTKITIWCRRSDQGLLFGVDDDGRSSPTPAHRNKQRAGLGLAIVRKILASHNSQLMFSQTPQGKSFSFRLPHVTLHKTKVSRIVSGERLLGETPSFKET